MDNLIAASTERSLKFSENATLIHGLARIRIAIHLISIDVLEHKILRFKFYVKYL